MTVTDPHAVLGLRSGASVEEIVRAYRRLARRWHPDVTNDPATIENFLALTVAYEQLLAAAEAAAHVESVAVRHVDSGVEPPLVAGPVHVTPVRYRRGDRDD
ncbi:MAG: J domain-containing protein [Nocardioidaceae bacterium]